MDALRAMTNRDIEARAQVLLEEQNERKRQQSLAANKGGRKR